MDRKITFVTAMFQYLFTTKKKTFLFNISDKFQSVAKVSL